MRLDFYKSIYFSVNIFSKGIHLKIPKFSEKLVRGALLYEKRLVFVSLRIIIILLTLWINIPI